MSVSRSQADIGRFIWQHKAFFKIQRSTGHKVIGLNESKRYPRGFLMTGCEIRMPGRVPKATTVGFMDGGRTTEIPVVLVGEVMWFLASPVCSALDLDHVTKALASHVDIPNRKKIPVWNSLGRPHPQWHVNEPGLYELALGSKKPAAKRLRQWITTEVLPAIKDTGSYSLPGLSPFGKEPKLSEVMLIAAKTQADLEASQQKVGALSLLVDSQDRALEIMSQRLEAGITPCQFGKTLNGVNCQAMGRFLESIGWLYDADREKNAVLADAGLTPKPAWRVAARVRDTYLLEKVGSRGDGSGKPTFTAVLTRRGVTKLIRLYEAGKLPMKKSWNGEFVHDMALLDQSEVE